MPGRAWYQRLVRLLTLGIAAAAVVAGCAQPGSGDPQRRLGAREPATAAAPAPGRIDANRLNRIRGELPREYEAGAADDVHSPAGYWGFRSNWVADPELCGVLAAQSRPPGGVRGLSASGPGGILYVTVLDQAEAGVDPALLAQCPSWTMRNEHSTALVRLADAPVIDRAQTTGMTAAIRTVVESGTETTSTAYAYCAYADDHVVFVVLVTDPGAVVQPLDPQFAADLLVKSVAALRP
jgi:Domain of unknown function (DUF5642)